MLITQRIFIVVYIVSKQPIGPVLDCLTLQYRTDRLSRNVGKQLPTYAAQQSRRNKISGYVTLEQARQCLRRLTIVEKSWTKWIGHYKMIVTFPSKTSPGNI